MIKIKKSKLPFVDKFFLLTVLFNSGTALAQQTKIPTICMLISFILVLLYYKQLKKRYITCFIISFFICSALIFQTIYYSGTESGIITFQMSVLAIITICYTFVSPKNNRLRFEYLIKLVILFSIIGIILYVPLILGINMPNIVTVKANNVRTIFYLCTYYTESISILGYRYACIFWEPGIYQIYLNLCIIYYLYKSDVKKNIPILVFLAAMIVTTYSTTGLALMASIFAFYFMQYKKVDNKKMIFILGLIVGAILFLPFVFQNYINKVTTLSYSYRTSDITIGLEFFQKNPLFGIGLNNDSYNRLFENRFGVYRGNSNGIINILIFLGLTGMILYVFILKKITSFMKSISGDESKIIYLIFLLVSFLTEPITFLPIVFLLFGFGLNNYEMI